VRDITERGVCVTERSQFPESSDDSQQNHLSDDYRQPYSVPYQHQREDDAFAERVVTPNEEKPTGSGIFGMIKETVQVVLPAILLALVIHVFLAQATVVYGQSMQPGLNPSERLVIEKFSYYLHSPQRGDIVVLNLPHIPELLIKRVVGLPGETIEIRNGTLYIDGVMQEESYEHVPGQTSFGPTTLRPMTYFVMGDNRINSNDSRAFGPVERDTIIGRAWMRYWPLNKFTIIR
jgi:signal peptidase I